MARPAYGDLIVAIVLQVERGQGAAKCCPIVVCEKGKVRFIKREPSYHWAKKAPDF